MRYMIRKEGSSPQDTYNKVRLSGGKDVKIHPKAGLVFGDIDGEAINKLVRLGFTLKQIGTTSIDQTSPPTPQEGDPIYSPVDLQISKGLDGLRNLSSPPLYGSGVNVAVIGTGIRQTHSMLSNRVVLTKNCTTFPDGDGFNHETGVGGIIVSIAPLCNIIDVKVIGDSGEGTEEDAAEGLEYLIGLHDEGNLLAPSIINMSLGSSDVDHDSAMRIAVRQAIQRGIIVIASAGNSGPGARTISSPAVEENVLAVGSVGYESLGTSEFSSRGPTIEGLVKPDCCMFGENIIIASSESDTATSGKSGTSFSAPEMTGICVLFREFFDRTNAQISDTSLSFSLTPQVLVSMLVPQSSQKIEYMGVKDNDQGWGIVLPSMTVPLFSTSTSSLSSGIDMSSMITMMMMVMMIGMMSKTMKA